MSDNPLIGQIIACRLCAFDHEPNPIVWGPLTAPIVIVGQAPSRKGHLTSIPWNDASGQLLRQWLGVTDDQFYQSGLFYLTALAHCFPGKSVRGGGDKLPPKICWDTWVKHEVTRAQPRLWLTVGRLACQTLLGPNDFTQTVFNSPHTFRDSPLWCLPHPSPANRRWLKQYPLFVTDKLPELRPVLRSLIIDC